ncbi:MAG: 2-dehydropantoate 2-reductase N-terminal domain-containing protein, partial [Planctomycetota bacterium]|nr:2-dehydropantoate 2-reductase N-terminal domain-containing protein [Planctomycetota bacterium]
MSTNDRSGVSRALVIGDGSWGTTLALRLARNGIDTVLWSAFPEQAAAMARDRSNEAFLPGIPFPENLSTTADTFSAAEGIDLVISVVPTQYVSQVALRFEDALKGDLPVVTAS